ncbi:hypothetical protein AB0G35_28990 [Streptomyces sp. NPDC021749]|uniref:hypothetical protein n=1 Tax=Streptomyces sp. NPDC021749 TaxID=3154905 RepID=UPI0033C664A1
MSYPIPPDDARNPARGERGCGERGRGEEARGAEHHRGGQPGHQAAGGRRAEQRHAERTAGLPGGIAHRGRGAAPPGAARPPSPPRWRPAWSARDCVDWGEQRHHRAGAPGAALSTRMFALDWLRHGTYRRVVRLTDAGREGLTAIFGVPADRLS